MKAYERSLEGRMKKAIRQRGGLFVKFASPADNGWPDRVAILPGGRIVFVELKREGATPTPRQSHCHEVLRNLGADVRVLTGWAEMRSFIEEVLPSEH